MKKWLSILVAAGLLLYPFATFGTDYGSQTSQNQQAPPVAQTLVREGDFAVDLATELDLGKPENEAVAEDMLARAGVAPANGWISDYPVTPEIIAQLKDSITAAAANGKLPMTSKEATNGLYSVAGQYSLPVPAGPRNSGTSPAAPSNPTVVNNYYYDEGPPVVTYYPPPPDYVYLYDWVPFPVVWFGFWFPGFFICHHFTTVAVVTTPFVTRGPAFVNRRAIVSNVVIDRATGATAVVDPIVRTSGGTVRPMTALRTENGRMFSTVTDMRRGNSTNSISAVRTGTGSGAWQRSERSTGFSSPEARRSARNIYTRNTMRGTAETTRTFTAPHQSTRSFSSPVTRGGSRGPTRWFNGNGGWGRRG